MWCLPQINTAYLTRMEEVLELYERPHNPQEPVVCLDEKPVSLHGEVRTPETARPGVVAKRDSETNAKALPTCFVPRSLAPDGTLRFPAPPLRSGVRQGHHHDCPPHHPLGGLQSQYSLPQIINQPLRPELGTHIWNRFTFHYTPKHGSWLNQAELEIGLFARQCLGKRRIADLAMLKSEARAWSRHVNRKRTLIHWRFSSQDACNVFHYQENLFMRSEN